MLIYVNFNLMVLRMRVSVSCDAHKPIWLANSKSSGTGRRRAQVKIGANFRSFTDCIIGISLLSTENYPKIDAMNKDRSHHRLSLVRIAMSLALDMDTSIGRDVQPDQIDFSDHGDGVRATSVKAVTTILKLATQLTLRIIFCSDHPEISPDGLENFDELVTRNCDLGGIAQPGNYLNWTFEISVNDDVPAPQMSEFDYKTEAYRFWLHKLWD